VNDILEKAREKIVQEKRKEIQLQKNEKGETGRKIGSKRGGVASVRHDQTGRPAFLSPLRNISSDGFQPETMINPLMERVLNGEKRGHQLSQGCLTPNGGRRC